jgi:hypothetical protein
MDSFESCANRTNKPFGRSLSDFKERNDTHHGLYPAEEKLLLPIGSADYELHYSLGAGRPKAGTPENTVRGRFIRFLALGGDDVAPVHEKGIRLHGAYIMEDIDLEDCEDLRALGLWDCTLAGSISLVDARSKSILLDGCEISEVIADRAHVDGNFFLRHSDVAKGVRLRGARIGGNLHLTGSTISRGARAAVDCSGIKVSGGVHLTEKYQAEGKTDFKGAEIGADFACDGGTFHGLDGSALDCSDAQIGGSVLLRAGFESEGLCTFEGATVEGDFGCEGGCFHPGDHTLIVNDGIREYAGTVLTIVSSSIKGRLWLAPDGNCPGPKLLGSLGLRLAKVTTLVDHAPSWPIPEVQIKGRCLPTYISLDGFRYERFGNEAPTDAVTREMWLRRQRLAHLSTSFRPQPFEQLIKVLEEMGYTRDARSMGFLKERLVARQPWTRARRYNPLSWLMYAVRWLVLEKALGHGYYPWRMILLATAMLITCGFSYDLAADQGLFAPSNARVYMDPELKKSCAPNNEPNWTGQTCDLLRRVPEYTRFNPYVYSLDVILPIVSLKQREDWQPISRPLSVRLPGYSVAIPLFSESPAVVSLPERTYQLPAYTIRSLVWIEAIFAWVWTLSLSAVATGIIKRD